MLGPMGWLQIGFVILKITDTVSWNWGIVLIPLWIGIICQMISIINKK